MLGGSVQLIATGEIDRGLAYPDASSVAEAVKLSRSSPPLTLSADVNSRDMRVGGDLLVYLIAPADNLIHSTLKMAACPPSSKAGWTRPVFCGRFSQIETRNSRT